MQCNKVVDIRLSVFLLALVAVGCSQNTTTVTYSGSQQAAEPVAAASPAETVNTGFPRTVLLGETQVIVHPPQVTAWEDFLQENIKLDFI